MLKRLRDFLSGGSQARIPAAPEKQQPGAVAREAESAEPSALDNPQEYLQRVQDKITHLAEEFAAGSINRAQFQELYEHYRREQQTVKRLLEMAPNSDEWRAATTEGKSVLIRQQNIAKVLGYAVYDNESGMPLNTIGEFEVEAELAIPMLSSYRAAAKEIFGAGMRSTEIEGGRFLGYMPGEYTTLMALFSTNPAEQQLESMEELHQLFERANRSLLSAPPVDPDELVFPHKYFLGRHA